MRWLSINVVLFKNLPITTMAFIIKIIFTIDSRAASSLYKCSILTKCRQMADKDGKYVNAKQFSGLWALPSPQDPSLPCQSFPPSSPQLHRQHSQENPALTQSPTLPVSLNSIQIKQESSCMTHLVSLVASLSL